MKKVKDCRTPRDLFEEMIDERIRQHDIDLENELFVQEFNANQEKESKRRIVKKISIIFGLLFVLIGYLLSSVDILIGSLVMIFGFLFFVVYVYE